MALRSIGGTAPGELPGELSDGLPGDGTLGVQGSDATGAAGRHQLPPTRDPSVNQDRLVATGFLRNSMINEEGGIDPEQFRMEAMFDRMDAIGKSILGLTIQCSQCHDHKDDLLTQEEYYELFAYLNNDHEANMPVYAPAEHRQRADILRRIKEIETGLQHQSPDWQERMAAWEDDVRNDQPEWVVVEPRVDEISSGGEVSELLPHLADVVDDIAIVKSMVTDAFNHAPAQIFMNTGAQQFGRPSLGAWVTYGLGSESRDLPGFVVLNSGKKGPSGGNSNFGSGFLPTMYQGVPFRGSGEPVLYLSNPRGVDAETQRATPTACRAGTSGSRTYTARSSRLEARHLARPERDAYWERWQTTGFFS